MSKKALRRKRRRQKYFLCAACGAMALLAVTLCVLIMTTPTRDAAFSGAVATRFARFEGEKLVSFEETQARQAEREQRDRAAEQVQLEISVLQMRMADLAARMSAPRRGDSPEKLNAEYQALAEQVRALKNPAR